MTEQMGDPSSQVGYEALARELSNRMTLSTIHQRQAYASQLRSFDVLRRLQDGSRISKPKSTHTTPKSSPVRHSTIRKHRSTRDLTSAANSLMIDQSLVSNQYGNYQDRPSSWHYLDQPTQISSNWQQMPCETSLAVNDWSMPADFYSFQTTQLEDQYASYQFPVPIPQPWYSMPSGLDASSPIQSPYDTWTYPQQPDFHDHISTIPTITEPVLEQFEPEPEEEEEAEGEVDDSFDSSKTELVGMGLYDRPSTQIQSSMLFSFDEPVAGKGLKLEESFVPVAEEVEEDSKGSESEASQDQPQSTDTSPTETVPELDFDTVDNDSLRWPSLDTDREDMYVVQQQQPVETHQGCYQAPDYTGVYHDTSGQVWNYDGMWTGAQLDEYGQIYGPNTAYYYTGY